MRLYKCRTIEQYKIGEWLETQEVTPDDVAFCEQLARNTVKVVNPAGGYLVVHWRDGHAEIDMTEEEWEHDAEGHFRPSERRQGERDAVYGEVSGPR